MKLIFIIKIRDIGFFNPVLNNHPNARNEYNVRSIRRKEKIDKSYCTNCSILLVDFMTVFVEFFICIFLTNIFLIFFLEI